MNEKKIRILFYNVDKAGVNYYRTLTPAIEIERNFSDKFHVEINSQIDFNDENVMDYLKSFDIIHYHRQFISDFNKMVSIKKELNESGTIFVMDIDDYWFLNEKHPLYALSKEKQTHIPIIKNIKLADYVTTTTQLFADEIKKITNKDNVRVFYNSINPEWMGQFQNNWKPDPDGRIRITYMAGSSHMADVEQLNGVINVLSNDNQLKDKFKVIIAGWDTEGSTTDIKLNDEFLKEMQEKNLWTVDLMQTIKKTRGNVDLIPQLSDEIKNRYRDNVLQYNKRDIDSKESVYFMYEQILTNNHKLIKNADYLEWLMNFERNVDYSNEENFARRWTEKANIYAKVLDETDIMIAPLANNHFNNMKSNLKQVECWSRKLPVVCSDIPPYNVYGKHMENCILIPTKKNAHKYWIKYLKKLILDDNLRKEIGENLYNDFKTSHNLKYVAEKRIKFYNNIKNK